LLSGEIGQQKRARDDDSGETAAGEEVALFTVLETTPGEAPGEDGNETGKEEEGDDSEGIHGGEKKSKR
jgi:hypothetical protein